MGIVFEMVGGGILGAGAGVVLGGATGAAVGYGVEHYSSTYLGREIGFTAMDGARRGGIGGSIYGFGEGVKAVIRAYPDPSMSSEADNITFNETDM